MKCGARRLAMLGAVAVGASALTQGAMWPAAEAQVVKAPRYTGVDTPQPQVNLPPLPPALTPHGTVVEDIVVRVNDQIISRSDVERAQQMLDQEAAQQNVPKTELAQRQKDMLRDMIDQQLLLSKAKELGLNADAEVIRRLDDIRKQNKMDSLDDLEKAARQQGVSFEDFKAQIRNQILQQEVVRDEVGRRLQMSQGDEQKYYETHKAEFEQPEQVRLSEILVPLPETATPAEVQQAEAKANDIKSKVMQGGDFADLAKKYSGGPSAAQGGDLGEFKRGALAKVLEDQTFALKPGESTQPIRTRQGFVILKVTAHDQAGPAPMKEVEPQIQEALYMQQMQPKLREYLTKLRNEAFVDVQPGFVDSGATGTESKPVFTAYAPPPVKKKKPKTMARFERGPVKPVVASPDTTGSRTITGPDAKPAIDPRTGLASLQVPAPPTTPGGKPKKVKREKIRYGQAPRNALPGGADDTTRTTADGAVIATTAQPAGTAAGAAGTAAGAAGAAAGAAGAAAGAAGAVADSGATVSGSPASESANLADNPLTPTAPPKVKTRFAATAKEEKVKKATTLSAKKQEKLTAKPEPMTAEESAAAKVQAAPLGVAGTDAAAKKPKKPKKVKGAPKVAKGPKERLADKQPLAPTPAPTVAPTANPALAPTTDAPAAEKRTPPPTTDQTTMPTNVAPPTTSPNPNGPPATPPPPGF